MKYWILICSIGYAFGQQVLQTTTGKLNGFIKDTDNGKKSAVYRSVPFARPPIGDRRFKRPVPYLDFEATINATQRHLACPQFHLKFSEDTYIDYGKVSEDCLYLNIFKPVTEEKNIPIVVYIYGGSFVSGSASIFVYDGDVFASETNTIYISINYRIGFFGFLHSGTREAPGNQGLYDVLEGLKWVKKNARAIGGDPDNITIWGQSAGAILAGILTASPLSSGLFHRAILQSGSTATGSGLFKQNTPETTMTTFVELGCMEVDDDWESKKEEALKCVKELQMEKILGYLELKGNSKSLALFAWQPVFGDAIIPEDPFVGRSQQLTTIKEVLMTSCANEGLLFTEVMKAKFGFEDLDLRTSFAFVIRLFFQVPLLVGSRILDRYFGVAEDNTSEPKGEEVENIVSSLFGDLFFDCPDEYYAAAAGRNKLKVYQGVFRFKSAVSLFRDLGNDSTISHGEDIFLTSGASLKLHEKAKRYENFAKFIKLRPPTEAENKFTLEVINLFGEFVRGGKPNIPGRDKKEWPLYTEGKPLSLYMAPNNFTVVKGLKSDKCRLWEPYLVKKPEMEGPTTEATTTAMMDEENVIRRGGKVLRQREGLHLYGSSTNVSSSVLFTLAVACAALASR